MEKYIIYWASVVAHISSNIKELDDNDNYHIEMYRIIKKINERRLSYSLMRLETAVIKSITK